MPKLRYVGPLGGPILIALSDLRQYETDDDNIVDVPDDVAAGCLEQPDNWELADPAAPDDHPAKPKRGAAR